MKTQPKVKGVRKLPCSTSMHPTVERIVAQEARRYGVSKSWVRATALAHYFNVSEQHEDYHSVKLVLVLPKKRKRA